MALQKTLSSPYHYTPSTTVAIIMIAFFGLSTALHTTQAIYHRLWYLLPTAGACGLLELLGWSARLWSSRNVTLVIPFQMQIAATILGPTPLLAANFVIFESVIARLGTQYSRLGAKWYTIIFCTSDVVSLVIQAVGGAQAAIAFGQGQDADPGSRLMLGGICFQLVVITLFALSCVEYIIRFKRDWPVAQLFGRRDPKVSQMRGEMGMGIIMMCTGLLFSTLTLFIRAIYRVIELSEGWLGDVIKNELLFNVLDGAMVLIAFYTLNVLHPGHLLKGTPPLSASDEVDGEQPGRSDVQLVAMGKP